MSETGDGFPFFVNGQRYSHETSGITGARVRTIAGVPPGQTLYIEEHGASSDQTISDPQTINLGQHIRHFYTENRHRRPTHYIFSVDAKWYESDQPALRGAEIKQIAHAEATNQLFLEAEGDSPDILVTDEHTELLSGSIKRY